MGTVGICISILGLTFAIVGTGYLLSVEVRKGSDKIVKAIGSKR